MIRVYSLVIFSFISFNLTFPQTNDSSPLQGELLLSFNGAVTVPKTDFFTTIPAPMGIGSVEYFFDIKSRNSLGLRFYGGIGTLEGADDNRIPEKYSDGIFFFGSGLTYGYAINNKLVPYLFFGISNIWYNPTDNNGNAILTGKPVSENLSAVTYNYETGVKIFLSSTSTLNIGAGEFISRADNLDGINAGNHNDVIFYGTVGISIAFFGQSDFDGDGIPDSEDACPDTPSGVEVDLTGCPPDSDGDGIPDYLDKCNGTPSGVKVDDTGCPIDSDKDGVPDYMDDCPHSPAGASVDAHGCVIDSDKDGVPDDKDNCPDTSPGVSVDARGCPKDSVSYENPDTLQKEEEETIPETEELNYNLNDEHLVKNMIFTDGKLYTVQISSWRIRSKAESEAEKLRGKGYNAFVNEFFIEKLNQNWFQVRVGYLKTLREAQELAEKLR